jgi:hypothetical protein
MDALYLVDNLMCFDNDNDNDNDISLDDSYIIYYGINNYRVYNEDFDLSNKYLGNYTSDGSAYNLVEC